ncbi:MAG TPA: PEGA domain-containing protein [Pyrinomonadaceae bacterium]
MRKSLIALSVLSAILYPTNLSQTFSQTQQTAATNQSVSPNSLKEDTPIRLRLTQTLSSGTAKLHDKVDFEVIEEIKVGELVVIGQGATAIGTVTEARPKKSFGRAGKLNVNIDYVRLVNGDKVSLRAIKGGSGGSHTAAMTAGVVATAIVFFPAAPLLFFIKGKNIIIPKGTEITAYVAADIVIDQAKFSSKEMASPTGNPSQASEETSKEPSSFATVLIKSTPDASDITIDGKFVGSTTSTLSLSPGDHTILIEKLGFKPWQRTITVSPNGSVTVDATLEKIPQ